MLHYLDNAATTPVHPQVAQVMVDVMTRDFGNPSSRYPLGGRAGARLKEDRAAVARAMGCAPGEVVFTSCGSEGDNWAIRGGAALNKRKGKHIITTAIEHSAVLQPCAALEREGWEVTCLKPDRTGHVSVEQVLAALRPDTALVSMMLVNNELGTVLPVGEAARAVHAADPRVLFHTDAVQGFLKVDATAKGLGVDLMSVSGHKLRGPKGVGALYVRSGVKLPPMLLGGGQEGGLRAGTEATAQIAGLAEACRLSRGAEDWKCMSALKTYALEELQRALPQLKVISHGEAPHICAVTLPGYKSEVVVRVLGDQGVCVSSGSACHKGKPSHVYAALGLPKAWLDGALRISFSPDSTREDVDALVSALTQAAGSLFTTLS